MFFVYTIQNRADNRLYVGQTNKPLTRWSAHKGEARKGLVRPLYEDMRALGHGAFTFTVIESHETQADVNDAERFWIEYFKADCHLFGYNLAAGGTTQHCAASRRKMSDKAKVSQRARFEKQSERDKLSQAHKGIRHTDESRAKVSDTLRLHVAANPSFMDAAHLAARAPEARTKRSESMRSRYALDPSLRARVSSKGQKRSIEACERMSRAAKQREAAKKAAKDPR